MSSGTVIARITTSDAQIPLADAAVSFWRMQDGKPVLLALRITDRSGATKPFTLETPPVSNSTDCCGESPAYATVNLRAEMEGYDRISVLGVQVYADTRSVQQFRLVPTPVFPGNADRTQRIVIPSPEVEG